MSPTDPNFATFTPTNGGAWTGHTDAFGYAPFNAYAPAAAPPPPPPPPSSLRPPPSASEAGNLPAQQQSAAADATAAALQQLQAEMARLSAQLQQERASAEQQLAQVRAELEQTRADAAGAPQRQRSEQRGDGATPGGRPGSRTTPRGLHARYSRTLTLAAHDEDEEERVPTKLRSLPSATVTFLSSSLDAKSIPRLLRLFPKRCSLLHPIMEELLALGDEESVENDEELANADRWLANALLDCLDASSTHVKNFLEEVSDEQLSSGRALLAAVRKRASLRLGSERRAAENDFDARQPFKNGMAVENVEEEAHSLILEYKRLPRYNPSDPLGVRLMLIRKMPASKQRDDLEDELYTADIAAKDDAERLSKPWTEKELIKVIALKLRGTRAAAHFAAVDGQKQQGEQQRGGADVCESCGQAGHRSRECSKRCSKCGVKNCPGTYAGADGCIMAKADKPRNVRNARGSKVKDTVYQSLIKEHQKRHPRAYAAEADSQQGEQQDERAAEGAATAAVAAAAVAGGAGGPVLHAHAGDAHAPTPPPAAPRSPPEPPAPRREPPEPEGQQPTPARPQRRFKRALRRAAREATRQAAAAERTAAATAAASERMQGVLERLSLCGDACCTGVPPFARRARP